MAKKRSSSVRSKGARRSSGGSGVPSWKNSKPLAIILIVVISGAVINLLYSMFGGGRDGIIPSDFPWAYLAAEDNGNYGAVLIKRGSRQQKVPFEEGGKKYWEAHICLNENCPGRTGDKKTPYIYAVVMPDRPPMPENPTPEQEAMMYEPDNMMEVTGCPLCLKKWKTVPQKYKQYFDPMNNERYMTQEAKDIFKKIREERKRKK